MKKIGLTIDSRADLAQEVITNNEIDVIDFHIDFGEFASFEGTIFDKQRAGQKLG